MQAIQVEPVSFFSLEYAGDLCIIILWRNKE
jgi:hypothetical protein